MGKNGSRKRKHVVEAEEDEVEEEATCFHENKSDTSQEERDTGSNTEEDEEDTIEQEMGDEELDELDEEELDGEDEEEEEDDSEGQEEEDEEEDDDSEGQKEEDEEGGDIAKKLAGEEMEELEKERKNICNERQSLLSNLKRHKSDDAEKGHAVKNQKALWDKSLELRFLLQKAFTSSNKLPEESIKSKICDYDEAVSQAYSDLISSSQQTLNSLVELQESLIERNPSIPSTADDLSVNVEVQDDEEWSQINKMLKRITPFRNSAVDKWNRKTQAATGAAAFKGKLHAFNQNISEQVCSFMRDPSRLVKRMQLRGCVVGVLGTANERSTAENEDADADGDPELIDDSEFYQQLLKEFLESCDLMSSEAAFYAMKKLQTKKRKITDRRASKSRKIRYNVHDKIVNFMAPKKVHLPPMAPKLFENLFGLKNQVPKVLC